MTLRATPKARRLLATILSCLAGVMVVSAAGFLGYPKYTDMKANRQQKVLRTELATSAALRQAYQNAAQPGAAGKKVVLAEGSAMTRIQIPRLHLDTVVVQGTSDQALAAGAGHYPQTPLPCANSGNVGIAGHRTMNGHPFQRLDTLTPGDRVVLTTPFESCTYQIVAAVDGHANPYVTEPNDWTVVAQTPKPMLTMSTCTPEGTARQRLVARAELVSKTSAAGSTVK